MAGLGRSAGRSRRAAFLFTALVLVIGGTATAGTIKIAWDPITHPDLVGYRVYHGPSSSNYTQTIDVGLGTNATLSGLAECTTRYIAVKARAGDGSESPLFSNEISGWPRPQLLSASPSAAQRNATLDLTVGGWNFEPGATVSFDDPAIQINNVTINGCSQLVVNISVGASAALGPLGIDVRNPDQALGSSTSLVSVTADADAPVISSVAASNIGSTTADIGWTTDEPADSQVFFRKQGETTYQSSSLDTNLVTNHSVGLFGLSPDQPYEYYVISADSTGNSAVSTPVRNFTTQPNGYAYLHFEAEAGPIANPLESLSIAGAFQGQTLAVQNGTSQGNPNNPAGTKDYDVNLPAGGNWNVWLRIYAPTSNATDWMWRVDGGSFEIIAAGPINQWHWVAGSSVSLSQGLHRFTLGGRDARARVDRVLLTDDPGFTPSAEPGSDVTAPGAVSALTEQASSGQVALAWTNPSATDLDRIVVRYRTDGAYPMTPLDGEAAFDFSAAPGAAENRNHTGLIDGVTYHYSVFAIDGSGNVSAAASVQSTPQPPTAPLGQVPNLHRNDTS